MPFSRLMHQWHIHVVGSPLVFESTLFLYPLRHPATGPTCGFWAYLYSSSASLSCQDLRMSLSVSNLILFTSKLAYFEVVPICQHPPNPFQRTETEGRNSANIFSFSVIYFFVLPILDTLCPYSIVVSHSIQFAVLR